MHASTQPVRIRTPNPQSGTAYDTSAEAPSTKRGGMLRLGVFNRYEEAQEIVDRLSDAGFEVERTAIVAEGLRVYEQVTGRKSWLGSLSAGAFQGLLVGLFIAWLFSILAIAAPAIGLLNVLLWGAAIGVVIGAALALVAHAASGGHRDFTSVSGVEAKSYTVLVEAEFADEARRVLGMPTTEGGERAATEAAL